MKKIKTTFFVLFFLLSTAIVHAQNETGKSAFGETMRSNGRIYVVIAVMLTILAGLIIYLVRLDKKMTRIEKELTN